MSGARVFLGFVLALSAGCHAGPKLGTTNTGSSEPPCVPSPTRPSMLVGVVRDETSNEPLRGARITLRCVCLDRVHEAVVDDDGLYKFVGLPAGTYTVSVAFGRAKVEKTMPVWTGEKARMNLNLDPDDPALVQIKVERRNGRCPVASLR